MNNEVNNNNGLTANSFPYLPWINVFVCMRMGSPESTFYLGIVSPQLAWSLHESPFCYIQIQLEINI